MSKIGNYRVELQEDPDYKLGWKIAEQGRPNMEPALGKLYRERIERVRLGWQDYHDQERSQ